LTADIKHIVHKPKWT